LEDHHLGGGLRADAVTAPFVIDRAMNGRIFRTYVERCRALGDGLVVPDPGFWSQR
jgi:hypothetical protein